MKNQLPKLSMVLIGFVAGATFLMSCSSGDGNNKEQLEVEEPVIIENLPVSLIDIWQYRLTYTNHPCEGLIFIGERQIPAFTTCPLCGGIPVNPDFTKTGWFWHIGEVGTINEFGDCETHNTNGGSDTWDGRPSVLNFEEYSAFVVMDALRNPDIQDFLVTGYRENRIAERKIFTDGHTLDYVFTR